MGVAPHKRNERLLVEATTLNLHLSIPVTRLADAPVTGGDGAILAQVWLKVNATFSTTMLHLLIADKSFSLLV